jgi:hypothetical protein
MDNILWMGKEVGLSPLYKIFVGGCQVENKAENQEKKQSAEKTPSLLKRSKKNLRD